MNKQEIASLTVKLLALSVVVNTVITLARSQAPYFEQQFFAMTQGVIPPVGQGSFSSLAWNEIYAWIFPLLVAFLLWRFSDWIGRRMVTKTDDHKVKTALTALEIQSIVLSAIGLFIVISALPEFVIFLAYVSSPSLSDANFSTAFLSIINPLLMVILGAFLLFRGSHLAGYLQKKK